ncbi:MAG: PRC-barrel domain-containing protein [Dietzia sp.]
MTLKDQLDALLDATAFDSTGTKIGAVRQVYVDDASGKITFATVSTGIFSSDAIVPLHGARLLDDELHVDHTRTVIRDSPRPDHTEDALTPEQEVRLLEYYGIEAPVRGRKTAPSAPGTKAGNKPAEKRAEKKLREAETQGEETPAKATPAKEAPGTTTPPQAAVTPGEKPGGKPGVTTTRSAETAEAEGRKTGRTEAPEGAGGTPDSGGATGDSPGRDPRT